MQTGLSKSWKKPHETYLKTSTPRRTSLEEFMDFSDCTAKEIRLILSQKKETRTMETIANIQASGGNPVMRVFANHIYEYKKGVRRMVLFTVNNRYADEAVRRLGNEGIAYELQEVGNGRTNIFFGRSECIEVVRRMITRPLQELSPEEDFILGALLGYDICMQCERFCKRTTCAGKAS